MGSFESKYIYPYTKEIANVFTVHWWTYSWYELAQKNSYWNFNYKINQKHKKIKFDFKYSKAKIEFLDVLVYKGIKNILQTTIY